VIKLHVLQAEYGDCFILETKFGKDSVNVLIDGGPYQTFEKHLKPTLKKIPLNGKLDLVVLSHIDNDHVIGLLDLLAEIKNQRERGGKELVKIEKIWHNSFNDLLELQEEPKKLLGNIFSAKSMVKWSNTKESLVMKGFQQGTDLTNLAKILKIPTNPDFDNIIVVNDKIRSVRLNNLSIQLLGPTKKNVDKLRKEWKKWLEKKKIEKTVFGVLELLDKSVPNLASITFLASIKNRKILFTGDCLGNDIVDMLSKNSMLDRNGKFYVDVLKVPHHGSDRNTSLEFFEIVNADYYVISANGRDDNPSLSTLRWILESGKRSGKPKKIILTNMIPSAKKILQEYDQNNYNYESIVLNAKSHLMTIDLK
jgi:beta-lactamase superfamily II metal-dependent hydrolase